MRKMAFIVSIFALLATIGCTKEADNKYDRADLGRVSTVAKGTVLSVRPVEVGGSNSGIGAGAGAIAGGTAGSTIGGSVEANIIGAVGGAVVGGVAGAMAESGLTSGKAHEFVVQKDDGKTVAIVQGNEQGLQVGERVLLLQSGKVRLVRDETVPVAVPENKPATESKSKP